MIFKDNYYRSINNRREPFLNYAKRHKFDPLVADHWYYAVPKIRSAKAVNILIITIKNILIILFIGIQWSFEVLQ